VDGDLSVPPHTVESVNQDDFFEEIQSMDPWGGGSTSATKLRRDLLTDLRIGPVPGVDDLDAAIALTQLVWNDLIAYDTGGGNVLDDMELTLAQRALTATLGRIGITLSFPWRDFTTFRSHWMRNDCSGSWQARRDLLEELLAPVQAELDRQEDAQFRVVNAEAVSPHTKTGWPKVDEELTELRRRFRTATTTQDYRDVGNRSVAVLEALSRTRQVPLDLTHLKDIRNKPDSDELRSLVRVNTVALVTQPTPHRVRALGLLARNRCRSAPRAPHSPRSRRQSLRLP
jgi:hypothetical protein